LAHGAAKSPTSGNPALKIKREIAGKKIMQQSFILKQMKMAWLFGDGQT